MANTSGGSGAPSGGQTPYPYAEPSDTEQWAQDFLYGIGAPKSQGLYGGPSETAYVEDWEHAESPSGWGYNPLGTEQPEPGSFTDPQNAAQGGSVQDFTSWGQGLQAQYDTLANNPGNATLVGDLKAGNTPASELNYAQQSGSWKTGAETNLSGAPDNTPFTFSGGAGTVQGYGNAAAPGSPSAGGAVPGWLKAIDVLQTKGANSGTIIYGSIENTIVKVAVDLGFGAVGFLFLAGGLIVLFGPAFLSKASQATGFGRPGTALQVSRESTARAAAIRSDIEQREAQRETFRAARAEQEQEFSLQKIQARKQANLDLVKARRAGKRTIKAPKEAAPKPQPRRQMTPPGPEPGAPLG